MRATGTQPLPDTAASASVGVDAASDDPPRSAAPMTNDWSC